MPKYKVLNREGRWRKPHLLEQEVYRALQRFHTLHDREKAAFIKAWRADDGKAIVPGGEATRYRETLVHYQDRVCEGRISCHALVREAFGDWSLKAYGGVLAAEIKGMADELIDMVESGDYRDMQPDAFISTLQRIGNAIPYTRRPRCRI